MKRRELYNYHESLVGVSELKGVKFAYTVLKNKKKIEDEIVIFEEVIKPNVLFEEYEKKRIDVCIKHSERDENNNPIIINSKYKLIDVNLFNNDLNELKEKYKDIIDERNIQINEYNLMLNDDIDIDFLKINFNDVPENISAKQLEDISFMINMDI